MSIVKFNHINLRYLDALIKNLNDIDEKIDILSKICEKQDKENLLIKNYFENDFKSRTK